MSSRPDTNSTGLLSGWISICRPIQSPSKWAYHHPFCPPLLGLPSWLGLTKGIRKYRWSVLVLAPPAAPLTPPLATPPPSAAAAALALRAASAMTEEGARIVSPSKALVVAAPLAPPPPELPPSFLFLFFAFHAW